MKVGASELPAWSQRLPGEDVLFHISASASTRTHQTDPWGGQLASIKLVKISKTFWIIRSDHNSQSTFPSLIILLLGAAPLCSQENWVGRSSSNEKWTIHTARLKFRDFPLTHPEPSLKVLTQLLPTLHLQKILLMSTGVSLARREQKQRKGQMCKVSFPNAKWTEAMVHPAWLQAHGRDGEVLQVFPELGVFNLCGLVLPFIWGHRRCCIWVLKSSDVPQTSDPAGWVKPLSRARNGRSAGRGAADIGPAQCNITGTTKLPAAETFAFLGASWITGWGTNWLNISEVITCQKRFRAVTAPRILPGIQAKPHWSSPFDKFSFPSCVA